MEYSKRIDYVNAKDFRKKGIMCPSCGGDNITVELHFDRFRIEECRDCLHSSRKFIDLKKPKPKRI